MPRSCPSETRLDSTPVGADAVLGVAHECITSELDLLHQNVLYVPNKSNNTVVWSDARCYRRGHSLCMIHSHSQPVREFAVKIFGFIIRPGFTVLQEPTKPRRNNYFSYLPQRCCAATLPDPLLLVPIQFSLVLHNSDFSGIFYASQTGRIMRQQLGILNQAFRGRLDGCKGDCVDTRIHFTPQACMDAPYPCLELDWQVEQLLFGPGTDMKVSDAWLDSAEGLAAVKHISSALNPQRTALNVLVVQDDTSPIRMRATWPWESSSDHGLPLHGVVITSSGLPGVMPMGPFSQGKSLVHAVGHWLGLLHTYHAPAGIDPCNGTLNTGDFVPDTPQQARANTLTCQADRTAMPCQDAPSDMLLDSCPCAPGLDDVTNFMDESPDVCLRRFSRCQAYRMHGVYWKYLAQEENALRINDIVQRTRHARAGALANGHIMDDLRSPRQTGWEHGWCATPSQLDANKAVSFGASVGLGVLVWAVALTAVLASYSAIRRKRHICRRLNRFRDSDDATTNTTIGPV